MLNVGLDVSVGLNETVGDSEGPTDGDAVGCVVCVGESDGVPVGRLLILGDICTTKKIVKLVKWRN